VPINKTVRLFYEHLTNVAITIKQTIHFDFNPKTRKHEMVDVVKTLLACTKRVKLCNSISQLRGITCHMRSHSVTGHPDTSEHIQL